MQRTFYLTIVLASVLVCTLDDRVVAQTNYEDDVKPLLRDHCLKCHNADDSEADLDLSSYEALLRGGSSGKVVFAGRPDSSQLFRAITHMEGVEAMPPESDKLADEKVAIVREWIQEGLVAGKGQKSQLRSIAEMSFDSVSAESSMPENLPKIAITKTVRPPLPQAMDTSPGASLLAVSGQEQILLYQIQGGQIQGGQIQGGEESIGACKLLGGLAFPEGNIHAIRFSRNGALLLAAGGCGAHSGRAVLFNVVNGERVGEFGDEVDSILAADISVDHKFVAIGGPSKAVAIIDTATGEEVHRIRKHTDWITALAFSPDGKLLATGDRSGGVHVWETERGAIVFTLDEHKVQVNELCWRGDGEVLASVAEDGNLILWDISDGWPLKNVVAHAKKSESRYTRSTGIVDVDFSSDGKLLTVGRDRMLRIWSGEGGKIKEATIGKTTPLTARFSADDLQIITGTFDGMLQLWEVDSLKSLNTIRNGSQD